MSERLAADRGQIEAFVKRVFGSPPQGYIRMCVFGSATASDTDKANKHRALEVRDVLVGPGRPWTEVIEAAAGMSERAALRPNAAVFCPPPCLFRDPSGATEANALGARVLKVELDREPELGEKRLREHVGEPSLIVYSGGYYTPEGEQRQSKRHIYYLLDRWISERMELIALKKANRLLGMIAGNYDPTAVTHVHPMRWPGSWNTKAQPAVLSRIIKSDGPTYEFIPIYARLQEVAQSLKLDTDITRKTMTVNGQTVEVNTAGIVDAVENILTGDALHNSINTVAMTLLQRPLLPEEAVGLSQILMKHSPAQDTRPAEWQERFEDIDRAVTSAYGKVSFGASDEELAAAMADATVEAKSSDNQAEPPAPDEAPADTSERKIRLYRVRAETFRKLMPPRPWLVRYMLLRGAVMSLAAAPGAGKTMWNVQLAAALASGHLRQVIGDYEQFPPKHIKTLIINNEEPTDELLRRLQATVMHFGLPAEDVAGNLWVWGAENPKFVAARKRGFGQLVEKTGAANSLADMIRQLGLDLVITDPHISTHDGLNENDNGDMEKLAGVYRDIAKDTGAAILLTQHTRKPAVGSKETQAGDMHAARGGGSTAGAVRGMMTLAPPGTGKKSMELLGLNAEQIEEAALQLVRFDSAKGNYSPKRRPEFYRFQAVNLMNGREADGWEGDDIGVLVPISRHEIRQAFGQSFPDDIPAEGAAAEPIDGPAATGQGQPNGQRVTH